MFALAKRFIGGADEQPQVPDYSQPNAPTHGFRVIHVDQNSAAREAGIESLFDYIVAVNGHNLSAAITAGEAPFTAEPTAPIDQFLYEIESCRGGSVTLEVWSAKGRIQRSVYLPIAAKSENSGGDDPYEVGGTNSAQDNASPALATSANASSTSGGNTQPDARYSHESASSGYPRFSQDYSGQIIHGDFGVGLSIQWTSLESADHVWHVLNVAPNSPAEQAGLISHADYIVGAENGLLETGGEGLLARVVSRMVASSPSPEIELYVYNHDYDTVRPVRIQPNPNWGGTGMLGCGVGYGLLHRLPVVVGKFVESPATNSPGIYQRSSYYQSQNRPSSSRNNSHNLVPPGSTLFEADDEHNDNYTGNYNDSSEIITPVNLDNAAPHGPMNPSAAIAATQKRRLHPERHHNHYATTDLSAYFAEEEKRSRELDTPRRTPSADYASVPPPPLAKK